MLDLQWGFEGASRGWPLSSFLMVVIWLQLTRSLSYLLLQWFPLDVCCQFSHWQNGLSPLTFHGIHTTHGKLHYFCHTKWWAWLPLLSCPGLSCSIIVQILFPLLSSRRSANPVAEQKSNSEKKSVSSSFINPIFRSNSLSLQPSPQLHIKNSLSTNTCPMDLLISFFFDQEWIRVVVVIGLGVTLLS